MEQFKEIKYSSPKDAAEAGEAPQHRFDLLIDGEKIGSAEIDYFSKPLPLYQLTDLYVDFEHQGKGHASEIMEQVEAFLRDRKKPGVVADAILDSNAAAGMYDRRGWQKTNASLGPSHVYNWPEDVPLDILEQYPLRYRGYLERKVRKSD
ncbi:MAG TPA: GNAT family N-acetyltransferase [Candidatus Paceibacterota bacterium]|nr:GNAT family N-acetyltransferase [Candidatus Paceibacterota bacterium]